MTSENLDSSDNALDRTESFILDLFGNRIRKTLDLTGTSNDTTDIYSYDSSDRLQSESQYSGLYPTGTPSGSATETTTYGWTQTQQTSKTVAQPSVSTVTQQMVYGLGGRMEKVITTEQNGSGTVTARKQVEYRYDPQGIRFIATDTVDTNLATPAVDGSPTGSTEYLIDHSNFTGYQQTVIETVKNAAGQVIKRISYTFGSDEITQTVSTIDPNSGSVVSTENYTFGHDGHGSVRVLFEAAAAIAQVFTFAAYGELLSIHNSSGAAVGTVGAPGLAAQALTSVLYNGESFDSRIRQQYLRARWYDQSTGRFNRLDPFTGNPSDPFSFNKYGFGHANPVINTDPTGEFSLGGLSARIGIGATIGAFGAVGFNAIRNYAIGLPLFHGWKQAFLTGALIGGVGVISPWLFYAVSTYAVADSLAVAIDTIQDPNASWGQVAAALSLVVISGLGLGGSRAYAGKFGRISEGLGGSRWYSIQIASRPLGTKLVVPRGDNRAYFEYLTWAAEQPTGRIRGNLRTSETPNPSEHQISAGGLFEIPVNLFGRRFLYNVDEAGVGSIVRNPNEGTPGRTGHPFFGETSKAAGEVIFQGRRAIINDSTGRGTRNLTLAQRFFESLGYEVETRSWGGREFGDNYGTNGNVPEAAPGR